MRAHRRARHPSPRPPQGRGARLGHMARRVQRGEGYGGRLPVVICVDMVADPGRRRFVLVGGTTNLGVGLGPSSWIIHHYCS